MNCDAVDQARDAIRDTRDAIKAEHGENAARLADLFECLHCQTDLFVDSLKELHRINHEHPEAHNQRLLVYLGNNTLLGAAYAQLMDIDAQLSCEILQQVSAAHRKATTIIMCDGATIQ